VNSAGRIRLQRFDERCLATENATGPGQRKVRADEVRPTLPGGTVVFPESCLVDCDDGQFVLTAGMEKPGEH
jgi:hypothetical protein